MIQPGAGNEVQKKCTNNPLQSDSDGSECKYIFSRCDNPSPSKKRPRVEQERSGREGRTSIHIQWASFFAQTIHATGPPSRHEAGVPCEIDASGGKNENNRLTTGANSCNHRLSLCLSLSLSLSLLRELSSWLAFFFVPHRSTGILVFSRRVFVGYRDVSNMRDN